MNILTHLDTATLVGLVLSVVIPAVSSLLSREHWDTAVTGAVTLLLSGADGFFSQWAAHPSDFQWKAALGTAVASYALALLVRFGVLKDTNLDATLLAVGSPKSYAPNHATPAVQPDPAPSVIQVQPIGD